MALCPFATHKIIPAGSNDPPIRARVAVLHVAVSMVASLFEYFRDRSGGIESHFYVTWTGKLEQYRDTNRQADANYEANDFAVSIETAGMGSGTWNARQRRTIQRLLLWLHQVEGIPLRQIQNWDGSGVGYHVQFGAPGRWTPVAKSCPGPERIRQYNEWLVPWMRRDPTAPDLTRAEKRAARRLARVSAALEEARTQAKADKAEWESSRARVRRLVERKRELSE